MILNYTNWKSLNESNVFKDIKMWFSKNFGGKIEDLDTLASKYKRSEMEFFKEWSEIQEEVDSLKIREEQTKEDPAELASIKRMIERQQDLLNNSLEYKKRRSENILRQAEKIYSGSSDLEEYWESEKSKIDVAVSKEMYEFSKQLTASDYEDSLYKKYRSALDKSIEKEDKFREDYKGRAISYSRREDGELKKSGTPFSSSDLADMNLSDFSEKIKRVSKDLAQKIQKDLTDLRNSLYVEMDVENAKLQKKIDATTDPKEILGYEKNIKDNKKKYLDVIRTLRSKIQLAKNYSR
jgi:hypothetical protein